MGYPKYKCHKVVEAFKIGEIINNAEAGVCTILPKDGKLNNIGVSELWFERHKPEVGGYFVRYKDGYDSYSPAKAFEDGYRMAMDIVTGDVVSLNSGGPLLTVVEMIGNAYCKCAWIGEGSILQRAELPVESLRKNHTA